MNHKYSIILDNHPPQAQVENKFEAWIEAVQTEADTEVY